MDLQTFGYPIYTNKINPNNGQVVLNQMAFSGYLLNKRKKKHSKSLLERQTRLIPHIQTMITYFKSY